MLNRFHFITNDLSGAIEKPNDENFLFSLLINPEEEEETNKAYIHFSSPGSIYSSVTVYIDKLLNEKSMKSILSFIFIPAYKTISNTYVINLTGKNDLLFADAAHMLKNYFGSQNIDNLQINKLTVENNDLADNDVNSKVFDKADIFPDFYDFLLNSDQFYDNDIFFTAPNLQTFSSLIPTLIDLEERYSQKNVKLAALVRNNLELKRINGILYKENIGLSNELRNQKEYLDIMRSGHSSKKLQEYYNEQYEVLPAWYKRIGHLIKILTAKRKL